MHTAFSMLLASGLVVLLAGLARAEELWPMPDWPTATPDEVGMDLALLEEAKAYALTGDGSGCIVRHGRLVASWGDQQKRYDLKSTTKSIGVTCLSLALADGKVALTDKARRHHPTFGVPPQDNAETGWLEQITLLHLATQTAGFDKRGGWSRLLFEPGTAWCYSDCGPNWLAECLTLAYGRDLNDVMFERVFTPLGITPADLSWRNNAYRPDTLEGIKRREFGAGFHGNVNAMARIGLLYLRRGRWQDRQVIPAEFVDLARTTVPQVVGLPVKGDAKYGDAPNHYGLLWWNNADGTLTGVPTDAYWSWGLYDSFIIVVPSLDLVVARAGESWKRTGDGHYDVLAPFLCPIVRSVRSAVR